MTTHDHEHYCEAHDWKTIGEVSTDNGTLAIVAPYFANSLGQWWNDYLTLPSHERRRDDLGDFRTKQLDLRQTTWKTAGAGEHVSYQDQQRALLVPCDNNSYDVELRRCELPWTVPICELRIRFHVTNGIDWHTYDPDSETTP